MHKKNRDYCADKVFLVYDKTEATVYVVPVNVILQFSSDSKMAIPSPSLTEIHKTTYRSVDHFIEEVRKLGILGTEKIRKYKAPPEKGISYQMYFADTAAQVLKTYREEFQENTPKITAELIKECLRLSPHENCTECPCTEEECLWCLTTTEILTDKTEAPFILPEIEDAYKELAPMDIEEYPWTTTAIKALGDYRPWILSKDALPPEDGEYEVSLFEDDINNTSTASGFFKDGVFFLDLSQEGTVYAWRPKAEPYNQSLQRKPYTKYPTASDTNYANCLKSPERMAEKVAEFFTEIDPNIPTTSQFIANLVRDELRDWLEKPAEKREE